MVHRPIRGMKRVATKVNQVVMATDAARKQRSQRRFLVAGPGGWWPGGLGPPFKSLPLWCLHAVF